MLDDAAPFEQRSCATLKLDQLKTDTEGIQLVQQRVRFLQIEHIEGGCRFLDPEVILSASISGGLCAAPSTLSLCVGTRRAKRGSEPTWHYWVKQARRRLVDAGLVQRSNEPCKLTEQGRKHMDHREDVATEGLWDD
jgi:hypothetical protein